MVETGTAADQTEASPRSASTWVTDRIAGGHDFNVTSYSLNKGIGVGKYISSDTFNVGSYSWLIRFYPDGDRETSAGYVSLFIMLVSIAKDVKATYKLMILDQSGKGRNKVGVSSNPRIFSNPGEYCGMGSPKFIRQTDLEASCYLRCDSLHIRCHVEIVQSHIVRHKIHSIPLPLPEIGHHLGRLLETGEKTDVNFEVDGEKISAHKLLLAARSPVFNAQFYGPMKDENAHCIKVEDIKAPIFKAVLHFIYWDALPDLKDIGFNSNRAVPSVMFRLLLVAADRYCLDRLKLLCMAKLCDHISIANVAMTLAVADQCKASLLKSACLEFVALPGNFQAIRDTDDFKYLKRSCPDVCIELLDMIFPGEKQKQETCLDGIRVWMRQLSSLFSEFFPRNDIAHHEVRICSTRRG